MYFYSSVWSLANMGGGKETPWQEGAGTEIKVGTEAGFLGGFPACNVSVLIYERKGHKVGDEHQIG